MFHIMALIVYIYTNFRQHAATQMARESIVWLEENDDDIIFSKSMYTEISTVDVIT